MYSINSLGVSFRFSELYHVLIKMETMMMIVRFESYAERLAGEGHFILINTFTNFVIASIILL